jgi:hypothetical protein
MPSLDNRHRNKDGQRAPKKRPQRGGAWGRLTEPPTEGGVSSNRQPCARHGQAQELKLPANESFRLHNRLPQAGHDTWADSKCKD